MPMPAPSWRRLGTLGAATMAVAASSSAASVLASVCLRRLDDYSDFAPFGGWQVYLVEAALVVVVLASAFVFGRMTVRLCRELFGRNPHARAVLLAALLPGLLIGALAESPMRAAVSWASDRTAAADAARAKGIRMQQEYRLAPPRIAISRPAATPELAARMLSTADLGKGWYVVMRPGVTVGPIPTEAAARGATASVQEMLTAQHWSGASWSVDHFLAESQLVFPSHEAAAGYAARTIWAGQDWTVGPAVEHRVGAATVWVATPQRRGGKTRIGVFAVADTVFTVSLDGQGVDTGVVPAEFTSVLEAAVQRASTHR